MEEFDLSIVKGASFSKTFQYATKVEGIVTPIDLSNYSVGMQIRHTPANPTVLFDAVASNCVFISEPSQGKVRLDIPSELTEQMNFKKGVYDIVLISPEGDKSILAKGDVFVSYLVSRG
jgi:hypothetical protein